MRSRALSARNIGGKALVPVSSLLPFLGSKVKTEATDLLAFTPQIRALLKPSERCFRRDKLHESCSIQPKPQYPLALPPGIHPGPPKWPPDNGPAASARSAPRPQPAALRLRSPPARIGCRSPRLACVARPPNAPPHAPARKSLPL